MTKKRVHIIDSDPRLVQSLREAFIQGSFEVCALDRFRDARFLSDVGAPHLVIIRGDRELLREIRAHSEVHVIALVPDGDIELKVELLEEGADMCFFQTVEPRLLVAKARAIVRRWPALKLPKWGKREENPENSGERWQFKGLVVELNRRRVLLNNEILELTTAEFDLLKLFVTNVCEVLTRDTILDRLRGMSWNAMDRSVDILVSRLREKLGDDPKRPRFIQTIRSTGYQFIAESADA